MRLRYIAIFTLTTSIFLSCCMEEKERLKSKVCFFHYGGYGDTSYAILNGLVLYSDPSSATKSSLTPLKGATIKILGYEQTLDTDSNGCFVIYLNKGVFSFLIKKDGFQPLRITNYVSDPDQSSEIKIQLEKGHGEQTYIIPQGGTK